MKTVVICGPSSSSGVERTAELVKEHGGNPIIVPMLSGFEAIPGADVHVIFRRKAMSLESYRPVPGDKVKVGIIYANSAACEELGPKDLEAIPGADLLYLFPVENVSAWIRKILGDTDEDEFSWNFVPDSETSIIFPQKQKRLKIATYSPMGGVGKTTAAAILGKLAEEAGHTVCIVESDNDNAGILQALGADPATEGLGSILEEEWSRPELFGVRASQCLRKVGGIDVLPIGADTLGMKCDQNNISNLYEWVNSQGYEVVIYDLPPQLAELSVYKALQEVDTVVLIGEPTTKAEEKLIRFVTRAKNLQGLKDIPAKLKLIINKYVPNTGIKDTEIAEAVGISLIATIPASPIEYYKAINDRKLFIPKDSPWRDAWRAIWGEDEPTEFKNIKKEKSPKKAKGGFWKQLLGLK